MTAIARRFTPRAFPLGRVLALNALLAGLLALSACTHVVPYDRARLAHPTMAIGPSAGPGESHMQAVHEGATGGAVGAESGCGCN
ncbi:DUF4266 domain-containing protein [Chondromyces apiculatus]|uniref:DUF4266 domain-containing protein n=1 Tax=Chondromyces apiculatus DSM 436 TaxID=1192034 RepID=A0A017T2P5_9BACT|nr:DUF4266 domain-containing protein [Chondromyces apiculatus]EYF02831.1 Hypothetical protein CAP_6411 [Chondromyces apiculatus DSM 436]